MNILDEIRNRANQPTVASREDVLAQQQHWRYFIPLAVTQ